MPDQEENLPASKKGRIRGERAITRRMARVSDLWEAGQRIDLRALQDYRPG